MGMVPCDCGVGTRIAGSTAGGCTVPFCHESLSLRVVLPDVPPARPPGAICSGGGCDTLGGATGGGASCGGAAWRVLRNGNARRRQAGRKSKQQPSGPSHLARTSRPARCSRLLRERGQIRSPGGLPGLEGSVCEDLNHASRGDGSFAGQVQRRGITTSWVAVVPVASIFAATR